VSGWISWIALQVNDKNQTDRMRPKTGQAIRPAPFL
jgi:hypothetical protein